MSRDGQFKAFIAAVMLIVVATTAFAERDHDMRDKARHRIEVDRPNLVIVESIEFDGLKIVLSGSGTNVNAVANFVENLKHDPMFTVPDITYIRRRGESKPEIYEFEYRFSIKE